jgi:hypothetical protein
LYNKPSRLTHNAYPHGVGRISTANVQQIAANKEGTAHHLLSLNRPSRKKSRHCFSKVFISLNDQNIVSGATLSDAYVASRLPIAERRCAEAGLRLAELLQQLLP